MWGKLVDMELDDDDKMDAVMPYPMPDKPDYPYGLRICLTHAELQKLGLEADCEVGDYLDLRAFATVTSVTKTEGSDGPCCRVEMQIEKLAVEDEMAEES